MGTLPPICNNQDFSFVFKYFAITVGMVILYKLILIVLDIINRHWFSQLKTEFDKNKKIEGVIYDYLRTDNHIDFKNKFVDECGDYLPFPKFRQKVYYKVGFHVVLEILITVIIGYSVFLICNNRINEAKTIFTILLTLAISYVLRKGIDKGYKDDNRIIANGWTTESIFKMLDNKSWKGKNKYTVAENYLKRIDEESKEMSKQSYDFLKWWLPTIIGYLSSIYFIWFGAKFEPIAP